MAQTDLAVRIATILDASGLKKADKSIQSLEKRAKSLGRTLGVSLGSAALVAFGKKAVQAFAADEKAATQLETAVKNLGLGFASANVTKFISDLETSASVADDELRPAFQALITTTGSLSKSQELLNLAIETSRGSGIGLTETAQDLANAYVGNTKGLKKYNLGLTQAELKAMSFTDVQKELADQFKGSNAAYLNTTAGKFEAISVASGNAAEVIGGSLVDAFITASGSNGAGELAVKIGLVSEKIANLIDDAAKLGFSIKSIFNPKYWKTGGIDQMWADYDKMLAQRQVAGARAFDPANNALTGYKVDRAAQLKAERDAKKRAADLIKAQQKNTAELKKQAALKKAGSLFDLEQIQLIAALKGNLSEEEQKRVRLQLALLTENTSEAQKLTYELAKAQGLGEQMARNLATLPDAKNPFASWAAYLDMIIEKARLAASIGSGNGGNVVTNVSAQDFSGFAMPTTLPSTSGSAAQFGSSTPWAQAAAQSIYVQIDGKTIASALQDQSLSGTSSFVTRGAFDR